MPEYVVLLRRAREEHFDALQAAVGAAAPQFAAYEEGARAAAARHAALLQLPATNPSALVGEELEVQRGEGGAAQSKRCRPLGSTRARPVCLPRARLAALGGSALPGGEAGPLGAQPLRRLLESATQLSPSPPRLNTQES